MLVNPVGRKLYEEALCELAHGNNAAARGLMSRSAKLDYLPAISTYATLLEHGVGGKRSMPKAVRWLKAATKRGDSASSLRLAIWFAEAGNFAEAKQSLALWGYGDSRRALLLAQLLARSRSCRATRAAKRALAIAGNGDHFSLSKEEREALRQLNVEFRKRNPTYGGTTRARPHGR
jgi:TPR repeat protein